MKKYITVNNRVLHENLTWNTIFKRLEDIADFRYDASGIFLWCTNNKCYMFYSTNIKSIFLNTLEDDGYTQDADYWY